MSFKTCPTCGSPQSAEEQNAYRCFRCNPPLDDEPEPEEN